MTNNYWLSVQYSAWKLDKFTWCAFATGVVNSFGMIVDIGYMATAAAYTTGL